MSDITEKILNEYEELRRKSDIRKKERISSVYKNHPCIAEYDSEIKKCGMEGMKKIMSHPFQASDINYEMKKKISELISKRNKYIKENNIDKDFDKNEYSCGICKDTGFIENKKCKCFIQKLIDEEFNNSNMGEKQKVQTFDKFNFSFYDKNRINDGISDFERIKKIYKISREFADNFDSFEKSLLFYGKPGLGKTFLSSCIANELMKNGKTVLYTRALKIFDVFERNRFGRGDTEKDSQIIKRIYSCDLLIIDDLGTEYITKNTPAYLYDFFDERVSNYKKIIINTNLTPQQLEKTYTNRFISRIYENFIIFKFEGSDIRLKK